MAEILPLVDNYAAVKPGDPIRLFPFGTLVKGGKRREITRELAARFKLPHFKAPIKLGSHEETTPAGGSLVGLEVRADGLYALTEWTDKGAKAITEGDYRYQSPEVIWEGAALDSNEGPQEGPLIIGMALLHTPHLGEAAALYEAAPIEKEINMSDEMVNVPKAWYTSVLDLFRTRPEPQPQPEPTPAPPPEPDNYAAAIQERDEYKARLETLEAEKRQAERVSQFDADLSKTKIAGLEGAAAMLASMTDEQAAWTLQQIRALSAQAADDLTQDIGAGGAGESADPVTQFNAAIEAEIKESKISYPAAVTKVALARPELYAAWKRS